MDELEQRQNKIKQKLENLNKNRFATEESLTKINKDIKDKIMLHNELVDSVNILKKDYKAKLEKFGVLKTYVKEYKKTQKQIIKNEYKLQAENTIAFLNRLKFLFKISVFKDFDEVKATKTENFPILDKKKRDFFEYKKIILKNQILKEIKDAMVDQTKIGNLVFFINFVIKYEAYFNEPAFTDFLKKSIKKEFEYHFLTDRESNRLDKPEWFFEFLLKKYVDLEDVFNIYRGCYKKICLGNKSINELIEATQELVFRKLSELLSVESTQKRALVLNFVTQFKQFSRKIYSNYTFNISNSQLKNMISAIQQQHIKKQLIEIHELRYVQWFNKYKDLLKETVLYIDNFGDIDQSFQLKDVVEQILAHMRAFLENLRFINREEIKVACFVFSELEDIKKYLEVEECEVSTRNCNIYVTNVKDNEQPKMIECNSIGTTINKITKFNADVFKLIKNLAINDVENTLKKISYFQFTKSETKRTAIVEINKIIDEYKTCIYSDILENIIQGKVDLFLSNDVLLKAKLTSNEYLEFKSFYSALKKGLVGFEWKTDEVCKCIDSIFEGKNLGTTMFNTVQHLYEN